MTKSKPIFNLKSEFEPAGDQPKAIMALSDGIKAGKRHQTLVGVTGSGKTFTAANVIRNANKPALVIAHNKTLAAQLAQEYREFFPDHAVHYFVSYYDYYQPEAYVAVTDTYIEKEAQINEEIDRLRHASTQALLTRKDVIVVASVSCIYGLGSPAQYMSVHLKLAKGASYTRSDLIRELVRIYFERTNADLTPGTFRAIGASLEIMPVNEKVVYRIDLQNDTVNSITLIDPVSQVVRSEEESLFIFPAKHFVSSEADKKRALASIKAELDERLPELEKEGKLLEGTIEEKTHQVMKNLKAVLEAADVTFAEVVKTTIYVINMGDYAKINEVYSSYLNDPFPARETICVKALPLGAALEISMIAIKK